LYRAVAVDSAHGPFGGLPAHLRFDNGLEWLSSAFTSALQLLGIQGDPLLTSGLSRTRVRCF
jgi:hypothetical protein